VKKYIQASIIQWQLYIAFILVFVWIYLLFQVKVQSKDQLKILHLSAVSRIYIDQINEDIKHFTVTNNKDIVVSIYKKLNFNEQFINALANGGTIEFQNEKIRIYKIDDKDVNLSIKNIQKSITTHQRIVSQINSSVNKNFNKPEKSYENEFKLISNNGLSIIQAWYEADNLLQHYFNKVEAKKEQISVLLLLLIASTVTFLLYQIRTKLFNSLEILRHQTRKISLGFLQQNIYKNNTEVGLLGKEIEKITDNIKNATRFAVDIGEGKFDADFENLSKDDTLGNALNEMRLKLKKVAEDENKRKWTINGVARFSELLRKNQNENLEDLSYLFLRELIQYLNSNQGGVFILSEDEEPQFELNACYAYDRKRALDKKLPLNHGLIGQCYRENDYIYIDKLPDDYIKITSGTGSALPKSLLLIPIKNNEKTYGVIELASFTIFEKFEIEFVQSVVNTFASSIGNVRINAHTQKLLADSKIQAEELVRKEEKLKQYTAQLEATQDQLNRQMSMLKEESSLNKSIIKAINQTSASIEFDLEGNILNANSMYLSLMEYTLEEISKMNEKVLVEKSEIESGMYDMMWNSLKTGGFNAGEYRRISKSGKELWLKGTYNPIFDSKGNPYKIIQFAEFTTEEKERELELTGKINAINNVLPIIEIDINGNVITTNQCTLNLLQLKRNDIRNKSLRDLTSKSDTDCENCEKIINSIKEGNSLQTEISIYNKNQERYIFQCLVSVSRKLNGEINRGIILLTDITKQRNLEKALKENLAFERTKNLMLNTNSNKNSQIQHQIADAIKKLKNIESGNIEKFISEIELPVCTINQNLTIEDKNKFFEQLSASDENIEKLIADDINIIKKKMNENQTFMTKINHNNFNSSIFVPVFNKYLKNTRYLMMVID
jgi:PAS domain S-box-containing protein